MFERRLGIFLALLLGAMGVLCTRLAWLELFDAERYARMAGSNVRRYRGEWLNTVRGTIYDRAGNVLAGDRPNFDLCLHYKLMRLFDDRYWQYQALSRSEGGEAIDLADARKYLRKEFALGADQVESLLDDIADACSVEFSDIETAIRREAAQLLTDLSRSAQVPTIDLVNQVQRVNDDVYGLQRAIARRKLCRELGREFVPAENAQAIRKAFEQLEPDAAIRAKLIGRTSVAEMNQAHTVLKGISEDIALLIEERFAGGVFSAASMADRLISARPSMQRRYPYGSTACHLIGQMGPIRPDLIVSGATAYDPPADHKLTAYHLSERMGDWGVECVFEDWLRGWRGWRRNLADPNGPMRIDPISGQDVWMTIDIELQQAVQEIFERHSYFGAAVVIDVPTGQIRAMVSVPTFDLESYYLPENYNRLNEIPAKDPERRRYNRAMSVKYEPGSTVKPTVLLGALQSGAVNSGAAFECDMRLQEAEWPSPPYCHYNHGFVDVRNAISRSCNVFLMRCALAMSPRAVVEWLKQAGLGRAILAWPPQADRDLLYRGFAEFSGNVGRAGLAGPSDLDIRTMSIGRGALDGTILQVANSMATIARDGVFAQPQLILNPAGRHRSQPIVDRKMDLELVRDGMLGAVYDRSGTAYKAFDPQAGLLPWPREKVLIYGKTGSTDYALFAGYAAGCDGSCLAFAVLVEQFGGGGGDVAAPVAREILLACARAGYLPQGEILEGD